MPPDSLQGAHLDRRRAATWVASLALLCGCGGGNPVAPLVPDDGHSHHAIVEETRALNGVCGVALDVNVLYDLRIEQGATETLWLRADEALLRYLETPVRDGILELTYPFDVSQASRPPLPIEAVLTVTDLEDVELRDGGRITASGLAVGALAVRSRGAGEIFAYDLSAGRLDVAVLGYGPVRLEGTVDRQRARLAGRGAYEAAGLASRQATVEVSHAGSATVRVSERLEAIIGGSGSIYYFGDPDVESRITGSGEVVRLGP